MKRFESSLKKVAEKRMKLSILLAIVLTLGVFVNVAYSATPISSIEPVNVSVVNTPIVALAPGSQIGITGSSDVVVNNTVANPVPVGITGTPLFSLAPGATVGITGTPYFNIANTPTVNLASGATVGITGTPGVNIANSPTVNLATGSTVGIDSTNNKVDIGTPNINIANSPTVNLTSDSSVTVGNTAANPVPVSITNGSINVGDVNVSNNATNPVLVRDVDNPTRQPVRITSHFLSIGNGEDSSRDTIYTVPLGKELVIEFVSAWVTAPIDQRAELFIAPVPSNVIPSFPAFGFALPLNYQFTNSVNTLSIGCGNCDILIGSQQMRIYADSGENIYYTLISNNHNGSYRGFIEISGYLVDVP